MATHSQPALSHQPVETCTCTSDELQNAVPSYKLHVSRGLRAAGYRLQHKLQVTSYKLQVTSYKLQATSYKLQVTSYKLQVTSYKAAGRPQGVLGAGAEDEPPESYKSQVTSHKLQVTSHKLQVTLAGEDEPPLSLGAVPQELHDDVIRVLAADELPQLLVVAARFERAPLSWTEPCSLD